jgi:hypothetical protein
MINLFRDRVGVHGIGDAAFEQVLTGCDLRLEDSAFNVGNAMAPWQPFANPRASRVCLREATATVGTDRAA